MGPALDPIKRIRKMAQQDANFRRELRANLKEVLERELHRDVSEEELKLAAEELKKME